MTTNKPNLKFSILITTYNAEDIVEETLKSILSQSYSNFEVIISDDRSTDKTVSVVKKIQDKRIVIYQNDHNLGYPGNMEVGRQKCRGDILYLMGQDDILGEGALDRTFGFPAMSASRSGPKNNLTPIRMKLYPSLMKRRG